MQPPLGTRRSCSSLLTQPCLSHFHLFNGDYMRSIAYSLTAPLFALGLAFAPRTADEAQDREAIRQTIQYYFDGGTNADSVTLARAFYPDARMLFVRENKLTVVPIQEYIQRVGSSKPSPNDATKKRIVAIDLSGTAATAKLEIARPEVVLTDYMSLLKIDGEWKIVSKIFSRQDVSGASPGK